MTNPLMEKTEHVVSEGGLLARLYFDLHAKSEDSLKDLAVGFSASLDKVPGVEFAISEIENPVEEEGGTFSTYVTATLLFKDLASFFNLIINYTPMSIEVLKPEEFKISAADLSEAALTIANYANLMKIKMYKETLSDKEKAYIETIVRKRQEFGKKLRGDGDGS